MRYNSTADSQHLRRAAMGPVAAIAQRRYAVPIPGRGITGFQQGGARTSLRGFGATSLGPPVGAGAGAGAEIGASQGATIGSAIVPGIGTAIGAVIGAIGGAIAGAINKKDPEDHNFVQAVAMWQQNPASVYSIGNPYLALAGMFDLNIKTNIPIYRKFGHMGEAAFVVWLCNTVYQAAQTGQIGPTDTALSVMSKVVQPQIDSWGYGPMVDPHADMVQKLIVTMILQYCSGAQTNWRAIGGDYPTQFRSIPAFTFPQSAAPTASPTPSPLPTLPPPSNYAASGSYLIAGRPGTLITQQGAWELSGAGVYTVNGNASGAYTPAYTHGPGTLGLLYQNGQIYAYNNDGGSYVWSGSTWTPTAQVPVPPAALGFQTATQIAAAQAAAAQAASQAAQQAAAAQTAATQAAAAQAAAAQNAATSQAAQTSAAQSVAPASASNTVSTVPPAMGAAITYAQDNATGKMVALPQGGTYAGQTTTGGWLVNYTNVAGVPSGVYESNNGVLSLYGGSAASAIPAGYTQTAQSVLLNGQQYPLYSDSLGNSYVWTGGNMIPYTSNTAAQTAAAATTTSVGGGGGGGGGGYYAPSTSSPQSMAPLTDMPPAGDNTLLLLGAAAVGVFLLMGGA